MDNTFDYGLVKVSIGLDQSLAKTGYKGSITND